MLGTTEKILGISLLVAACGGTSGNGPTATDVGPAVTVNGSAGGLTLQDPQVTVAPEAINVAGDYAVPPGSGYAVLNVIITNPGVTCAQGQSGKELAISLMANDGQTALTTGVRTLNTFYGPGYGSIADVVEFDAQCVDTGVGDERAGSGSVDITSLSLTHIKATFTLGFPDGTMTGTIDTSICQGGDAGTCG
jgi:hypothetical protein